jgi:ammonia channel protein AmtB
MPIEQVLRVIGSGALSSVIFCSLAVLILGKFKKGLPLAVKKASSSKSITAMCILSGIYVAIYFLFGYFIAWQFADIRLFYTESSNIVNLFTHLSNTMRDDTLLPLFQIFRGFLWAGIAFIIIHSLATRKILKYLVCPLLLGVLITSPLLLPNIYMPEMVRFGHSIELFTSMVLFGVISVFIDERI